MPGRTAADFLKHDGNVPGPLIPNAYAGLAISLPFVGLTRPFVFGAIVGPGRRCRRPLSVAAGVDKSEDNAIHTLHQRNKLDKRGAHTRRCPFAPALIGE